MNKQLRLAAGRSWLVIACVWLALSACGDDDGHAEADAGMPCNPSIQGAEACYCTTGTLGFRTCIASISQWGMCMCNELTPPVSCTPNTLIACQCEDGTWSQQYCRASNTRDPCMCEGHTLNDSGLDDATTIDATFVDGSNLDPDAN